MQILIVTRRAEALSAFADALAKGVGAELRFTDSWPNALAVARDLPPAFAVLDEGLEGGGPLELARRLIRVNAMGKHAKLLERCDIYRKLYELQFGVA